jgi:hypothetical protein
MAQADGFYDALPRVASFSQLTDASLYTGVPQGWFVGVADIAGSTREVAAGRYKVVNMVGAAVISALMNALGGRAFPFVFGGDGAGFAIGPDDADIANDALAAVSRWAAREFGITLRVALISVEDVRAAGLDLRVARFQVSDSADYAMFSGGGLHWAETRMKEGAYRIEGAANGALPDLNGLSCRWSHMPARNGTILSLVVQPEEGAEQERIAEVYRDVISLAEHLERAGHPGPASGPGADWPPPGATLEAHAVRGTGSLLRARIKPLLESFLAWVLIRTGLKLGGFDARRYARVVGENADFRKLDDGLKMTLDCDEVTQSRIEDILSKAADRGLLRYGIATQDSAMMTCIVPSILSDDHVHFIDGAAGGYTQAATRMKRR